MQRAIPTRMSPTMYSGWWRKKMSASTNMRVGPMSQFCTSESVRILVFEKTRGISSYFTFASGGYIMRMRPAAIRRLVVPTVTGAKKASGSAIRKVLSRTPSPMAAKIQTVSQRSRKDILRAIESDIGISEEVGSRLWVQGARKQMTCTFCQAAMIFGQVGIIQRAPGTPAPAFG